MSAATISALAALAGSAIGAIASFATTWLTQNSQERSRRHIEASSRRERLYGEFIEEGARLFADALVHQLQDPSMLVRLYALNGKLRLFAPEVVLEQAEIVLQRIVAAYEVPILSIDQLTTMEKTRFDVLKSFTEVCREDLKS